MLKYIMVFLLSGGTVTGVSWLANNGNEKLAGLLAFAPIVSLWSYIFIASTSSKTVLQSTVHSTIFAVPSVAAFIVSLHYMLKVMPAYAAISLSVLVWVVLAYLIMQLF